MIYLNEQQIRSFYGTPFSGPSSERFNAEKGRRHTDHAYKYEFGYINGHCVYAIIQKKTGSLISLEEAQGLRFLSGTGEWKLNVVFDPTKNPKELQEILDNRLHNLGYIYTPVATDQFKHPLICVHQGKREQLVIYHPKWRPDLAQVEADPL
jgi:hypothetical protein